MFPILLCQWLVILILIVWSFVNSRNISRHEEEIDDLCQSIFRLESMDGQVTDFEKGGEKTKPTSYQYFIECNSPQHFSPPWPGKIVTAWYLTEEELNELRRISKETKSTKEEPKV